MLSQQEAAAHVQAMGADQMWVGWSPLFPLGQSLSFLTLPELLPQPASALLIHPFQQEPQVCQQGSQAGLGPVWQNKACLCRCPITAVSIRPDSCVLAAYTWVRLTGKAWMMRDSAPLW